MLKRCLILTCCFAALVFLHPTPAQSQTASPTGKLEWRFNPLPLAYFNPHISLRIPTAKDWKPDFYLGLQLPGVAGRRFENLPIGIPTAIPGAVGGNITAYAGYTYMKNGWNEVGPRITLQVGLRAFYTGSVFYIPGYGDGTPCSRREEFRFAVGPRVLFGHYVKTSDNFGVELFAGIGTRLGLRFRKIHSRGQMNDGDCRDYLDFVPDTEFRPSFVIVPNAYLGLAFVFR